LAKLEAKGAEVEEDDEEEVVAGEEEAIFSEPTPTPPSLGVAAEAEGEVM
jgi:hypothetical protein